MNWVLALIGAVVGAGLADDRGVLGAVLGFLVVYLLVAVNRLRAEVAALDRKLAARMQAQAFAAAHGSPAAMPAVAPAAPMPMREPPASSSADAALPAGIAPPASIAQPSSIGNFARPEAAAFAAPPPAEPGWLARLAQRVKAWFTEGNVPVKIGVLVLLFGVAAALRYATAQGYFTFPIEIRLALIAGAAVAALLLGWRERLRRPAFGLSLQGGALGALLLTVFAAYRLYSLLPPTLALALVVVLVAGSALLAVMQQNMALAVLGFLGGYLAPVLISTGSANHIGLFSYYAVLNAAVFAISWRQSWRLLNLMGFAFTFGVGAAWGRQYYRPELFASVEPFLIVFFLFYIAIGLMYVLRQVEHRRPWVDGTLVFGTPLVAFPLQAAMLKDDRLGMAFSALLVALIYAGLVYWLRQRRGERLLTEAYAALALGFATLAVPLAFSASTTASLWALEGAGVAWLGLRQNRNLPWLGGLALQLLAAGAYAMALFDPPPHATSSQLLLLNSDFLGAAILAFAGFALSLMHDRHRARFALPALLFVWASCWWLFAGISQLDRADASIGQWRFAALYLAVSVAGAALLRERLAWPRLNWMIALAALAGVPLAIAADDQLGAALATPTLPGWAAYFSAMAWALWSAQRGPSRSLALAHASALWTLALALTMQAKDFNDAQHLAQGWQFLGLVSPVLLLSLGLWRASYVFAWPRAEQFRDYRAAWFGLAIPLMMLALFAGLFLEGSALPLPYMPLLNPLELSLLALALLLFALFANFTVLAPLRRTWPLLAFLFVTMAVLRAVHQLHQQPWSPALLNSGFSQACLTVVWSLIGVGAWIMGSRRANRQVWMGGAVLMIIVLLKLLAIDRNYMGNLPGIVSFMAVGLLLVGVGYIAPSPPKLQTLGEGA